MNNIVLLGAGGHCKSCIEIIETLEKYKIKGIVDKNKSERKFMGYKILGSDQNLKDLLSENDFGLVCVGQIKSPNIRIKLFDLLKNQSIKIATIKSKNSIISRNTIIKKGTITMHNTVINSGVEIGSNCIINTGSIIEHDSIIDDHCHISTGVIVNGNVRIGYGSFIGSGCIIKQGVNIGERVIVSAGEKIMNDIPSNTIYKNL